MNFLSQTQRRLQVTSWLVGEDVVPGCVVLKKENHSWRKVCSRNPEKIGISIIPHLISQQLPYLWQWPAGLKNNVSSAQDISTHTRGLIRNSNQES